MTRMTTIFKNGYFKELFEPQTYKNLLYFASSWLPFLLIVATIYLRTFPANLVLSTDSELPPTRWQDVLIGIGILALIVLMDARFVVFSIQYERTRAKWLLSADIPPRPEAQPRYIFGKRFKLPSLPTARELAFVILHAMFALATLILLGALLFATGALLSMPLIAIWQPPANAFSYWRDSLLWTGYEALRFTASSSIVAFIAGIPMLILTLQAINATARVWRVAAERAFSSDKSSLKAVHALEQAANGVLTQNTQLALQTILEQGIQASSAVGAQIQNVQIGEITTKKLPIILEQKQQLMVYFLHRPSSRDHKLWTALGIHISTALKLEQLLGAEREQERNRIARELHDSVAQALYGIALGTRSALEQLNNPEQAKKALEYARDLADAGTSEMKTLLFALRPDALEEGGLAAALHKLGEMLLARYKLEAIVTAPLEPEWTLEVKGTLYRIAQEAAHNTVKHAKAKQIWIRLEPLELEIRDNGQGFDTTQTRAGAIGLKSMRERAGSIGAQFEIDSSQAGTRILVILGGVK